MFNSDKMSLEQAIDRLQDSAKPKRDDLASVSKGASMSWDLNTDFSQARELAAVGWQEKGHLLWQQIHALALKVESGIQEHFDVAGESVDVGRFLAGEPECMSAQTIAPLSAIHVVLNISASASADAEHLLNRGIAVAAVIHALQSAGRGVSLTVCEGASSGSSLHETHIVMQEFGDYINPGRLAFWAAHPAALRRCIFRYNEQQEKKIREEFEFYTHGGYGTPTDLDQSKFPHGTVYIGYPTTSYLRSTFATPESALREVIREFKAKGVPISVSGEDTEE